MADGLVKRNTARKKVVDDDDDIDSKNQPTHNEEEDEKFKPKKTKFTLMEEILLLSFKDETGDSFIFNDTVSYAMRACILIELAIRGRIELESPGVRRRSCSRRNLLVVNNSLTGDALCDEALRVISESPEADSIQNWLNLLNGDTWNVLKLSYQMRNVRSRVAKGLAEKGVCSSSVQNFVLFSVTSHPISDASHKHNLNNYIVNLLTKNWRTWEHLDPRDFALLSIAYSTDIIENALSGLEDTDYHTAYSHIKQLGNIDPEKEIYALSQKTDPESKQTSSVKQIILGCLLALYDL